ncbi:MAG: hypothetical protein HOP29_15490 [Phycisphaerales bacterium]|nr:hypothetical protein [Phycisphaerales bacterium]
MRLNRSGWNRTLTVLLTVFGAGIARGQDRRINGERLDPSAYGPGVVESMDDALARQAEMGEQIQADGRKPEHGTWVIPSIRATYFPHSGQHYVMNKWGDTRMGIRFPGTVTLHGAYFAGQASEGVWAKGVRVVGYRGAEIVQTTEWFTDIGREPKFFEMNLPAVDRVVIESKATIGRAGWYAMDDLAYTPVSGAGRPGDRVVIDFEDGNYDLDLTDTTFRGLTWERGAGEFYNADAMPGPETPDEIRRAQEAANQAGSGPEEQSAVGGGGTTPELLLNFDAVRRGQGSSSSFPPDTDGAIGPNHYVETVNRVFAVYNKSTGAQVQLINLGSFLPGSSGDPRVLFDQHSGRWVVVVSDFSSRIYLAVSSTNDPTGSWFKTNFIVAQGSDAGKWPDYETLGVDARGIYTATFMVGGSNRMTIFAIDKAPLVAPVQSLGTITAFRELVWEGAIQPAHTYGDPGAQYFVSRATSSALRVRRVDPPLTAPTLTDQGFCIIPIHSSPPDAPAMGTTTPLDSVGDRLMMSMFRNGSIWTTHCVGVSGRGAARWYEIDAATNALLQSGTVNHASLHYIFPSIAVNNGGGVVLSFSGSNASTFPSAYYTGRVQSDPVGEMAPVQLLVAGTASQTLIDSFGRNRFGDYSYTNVDPANDQGIWTIQEYGRTTNNWGTWVGSFQIGDCNGNGISDQCDVDCGTPGGICDVAGCGQSEDCNGNIEPDDCETDCNNNDTQDDCDVDGGGSLDCNANGVPDECEPDCNGSGAPDDCDVASASSPDCNGNNIPDECDVNGQGSEDCQLNGVPDECDVESGSEDCIGPPTNCYTAHASPGCDNLLIENCVCAVDPGCCSGNYDSSCVFLANTFCQPCAPGGVPDGIPDECQQPCTIPAECDDGNACTVETCGGGGVCVFTGLTYDGDTECCDPATGNTQLLEDGDPCTHGTCNLQTGTVTQTAFPDGPRPGCGAEDPCSLAACQSAVCVTTPKIYGDVNNDGSVDIFDILCVLDGFAGVFTGCSMNDVDIVPCEAPDGTIDVFDILGVLDAFAGSSGCCP